jgi:hypothetical protein
MLECGKFDESATYLSSYFKETQNGEIGHTIFINNFPTMFITYLSFSCAGIESVLNIKYSFRDDSYFVLQVLHGGKPLLTSRQLLSYLRIFKYFVGPKGSYNGN